MGEWWRRWVRALSDLFRRVFGVVRKEIVEIIRQPGLLLILVVGPLAILLMFGSGVRPTDPAVDAIFVAPDNNPELQQLVESYAGAQDQRLTVKAVTTDLEDAERQLRRGQVQMIVIIPDVSVDRLQDDEREIVEVRHRYIDPLEAQAMQLFTDSAVDDINDLLVTLAIEETQTVADEALDEADEVLVENSEDAPEDLGPSEQEVRDSAEALIGQDANVLARPFRGDAQSIGGAVTTSQFYAPAVVALILQHLTITFVALSVSRERSQRTTEMFVVSPLRSRERVAGKVIAYMVIGSALGAAMLTAVVFLLGAPIRAGVGPVASVLALELAASIGVGFVLAAITRNTTQVVQGAMLLLLLSVFFGGLLLSPDRLLPWARPVGWILPMTHAIPLLRDSMLRGTALDAFRLVVLVGLAVAAVVWGGWRISRLERSG